MFQNFQFFTLKTQSNSQVVQQWIFIAAYKSTFQYELSFHYNIYNLQDPL